MHVLLVEPAFPSNQRQFARGLHRAGARVTGIGERPLAFLDDELKSWMHAYEQVPSVVHEESLLQTVRACQRRGRVDRLEATVEAHVMPAAHVREKCGIPGTSVETAWLCRDKPAMKEALRGSGVDCAQSTGAESAREVEEFVRRVGFPVILKPRSSAGAEGTIRVSNAEELAVAIRESQVDRGAAVAVEEFIEGHEGFYDTVSVNGEPIHEFISHYYPNVLSGMRERWISPQFLTTNRLDAPGYEQVREMGLKVIRALGIGTSATHMEWFSSPKGLKFSEIGCRPAGVDAWEVYCRAHEMDLYHDWARAITGQPPVERASQRFAAGHVALRPTQDGHIVGYRGMDEINRLYGEWITDTHFPPPGSPTAPIEAGFKANAWVRMRHPDYDELRRMLTHTSELLEVVAS